MVQVGQRWRSKYRGIVTVLGRNGEGVCWYVDGNGKQDWGYESAMELAWELVNEVPPAPALEID